LARFGGHHPDAPLFAAFSAQDAGWVGEIAPSIAEVLAVREPDITLQELTERYLVERGMRSRFPLCIERSSGSGPTRDFARLGPETSLERLIFFDEIASN